jgi:hypothetical protein
MLLDPLDSYGSCPCGGRYSLRQVEVRMAINGRPLNLQSVPQGACGQCGRHVYKLAELAALEGMMKGRWMRPPVHSSTSGPAQVRVPTAARPAGC